jgi:translation elongation factor aEF-1 beta
MVEYNVAAEVKIYVDEPNALNNVKKEISKIANVRGFKEEDVGFGIKALRATILFDDSKGGTDALEENIRKIAHVSQVEVESVTRI